MFEKLMRTEKDASALVLRVLMGLVFFPHGAQKVLGWFGGFGFEGTVGWMTTSLGIPTVFAVLAIAAEFLGSLGLILGFLTRVAAFGLAVEMATAAWMVHRPHGFFMNWTGQQQGEGFEFHILAVAVGVALMIRGGGLLSVDGALSRGRK